MAEGLQRGLGGVCGGLGQRGCQGDALKMEEFLYGIKVRRWCQSFFRDKSG